MTETFGIAAGSFSASHVLPGHPRCGRRHGHRWRVAVTIKAGVDPTSGELVSLPALASEVDRFCLELDREDVNDMLPGSPATPIGVALALHERLILHFGTIVAVEVWADDVGSTLRG